jgi:hypothetical protein
VTGNSIRITEFLVFCLPLIEAAVGLASISGLVVRLFRTNVGHRWLRISTPSMLRNTRFEPGFLGRDYTLVSVGRKWSVWPDVAFQFGGPSDWTNTQVFWLENHRLMIRYNQNETGDRPECKTVKPRALA